MLSLERHHGKTARETALRNNSTPHRRRSRRANDWAATAQTSTIKPRRTQQRIPETQPAAQLIGQWLRRPAPSSLAERGKEFPHANVDLGVRRFCRNSAAVPATKRNANAVLQLMGETFHCAFKCASAMFATNRRPRQSFAQDIIATKICNEQTTQASEPRHRRVHAYNHFLYPVRSYHLAPV